jgi:hypothetical protein
MDGESIPAIRANGTLTDPGGWVTAADYAGLTEESPDR